MSKQTLINKFFNPITLDEYRENLSRSVIHDPQVEPLLERGGFKARIVSVNTNGTNFTSKVLRGSTLRVQKAKSLQETAKKLKLDAILQQEVRTGSWFGQFPNSVRIFESTKTNTLAKRGGPVQYWSLPSHFFDKCGL